MGVSIHGKKKYPKKNHLKQTTASNNTVTLQFLYECNLASE